jgi:glycosyltransferase involved in cell wall biosynthesis
MANSLYICYFGLRQPLVQTQVLPYLRELRKDGHEVVLLTFEPEFSKSWSRDEIAAEKRRLLTEGIDWQLLPYHKRLSVLATAYDIFRGAASVRRIVGKREIDILHGRVHVPTLMGAIARKFSKRRPKLLFDIRGFFPEEYTDAGIWPKNGIVYRIVKKVEKWLMKESDAFVVLTKNARTVLFPECGDKQDETRDSLGRPVEVIPCCVDLTNRFAADTQKLRDGMRAQYSLEGRRVYVHAGALGGLYLTEKIADFLAEARRCDPATFALFVTQSDPHLITPLLQERGFGEEDRFVGHVSPAEVPGFLSASDVGLSFVKSGYATASRSPTKIPEYLACGLPIVANAGVGDVDALIEGNGVGALVREFAAEGYRDAIEKIEALGDAGVQCRSTAERLFDLDTVGGRRYRRLYEKLMADVERE